MNSFLQFFQHSHYENEYERLPSRNLHMILVYIFWGVGILGLLGTIFVFPAKLIGTAVFIIILLSTTWGIIMNRRDHTILVARLLFGLQWIMITFTVYISEGTQSLNIMFYIPGIVTSGLVLGANSAIIYSILSAIATLLMLILSTNNHIELPNMIPFPPITGWILLIMNMFLTLIPLNLTVKTLASALATAKKEIGQRKEIETELRHREERYRMATAVRTDYIFFTKFTADGGMFLDWVTGAFEQMTGYTHEAYQKMGGWRKMVHPDDIVKDEEDLTQLRQNKRVESEIRVIHKDGTVRWVQVYAHPVWDNEAEKLDGIYGTVQDVTERKQIEANLRASEEKFAKIFHVSPNSISISTLEADSQFIDVNEGFLRDSGYTREEALHCPVRELNLWPNAEKHDEVIQAITNNEFLIDKEVILLTKASEERNFLLSAKRIELGGKPHAVFIARNITKRKQIAENLRQSEKLYRSLIESLDIVLCRWLPDTTLTYTNQKYRQLFEIEGEAIGQKWVDYVPEADHANMIGLQHQMIANPQKLTFDHFASSPDGEEHYYQWVITAILDDEGNAIEFQSVGLDLTQHKQAETELRHQAILLNSISDAIITTDLAGRLQSWNSAAEALYGWKSSEVIGHLLTDIVPTQYLSISEEQAREQFLSNGKWKGEVVQKHRNGRDIYIQSTANIVYDESGKPISIMDINRDITEQKKIQEALRTSEEKFAKAFQASPDAILISAADGERKILDVNEGFETLTGYRRDEVIDNFATDFNLWHDPTEEQKALEVFQREGRLTRFEFQSSHKSGKPFSCILSAELIEIEGKPHVVSIIRDISQRKQAEKALRTSEEKFAKAFQASPDSIALITLGTNSTILEVNDAFVRNTGFSREEVINKRMLDMPQWVKPEDQFRLGDILRLNGRVINEQVTLYKKSGDPLDALISAEKIQISDELCAVIITHDITKQVEAETALAHERLLLRTVIDTMPDYIYLRDTKHRYLVSNLANAHALGTTSPQEVEGKTLHDFYSPAEATRFTTQDNLILETGEATLNQETHHVDPETDEQHWEWMSRIPFRGADGRLRGIVGIRRDITDYKQAQLEREQLITELKTKNSELERFTYTVSHDLKSPLVTITGFLGYLENDIRQGGEARIQKDIEMIRTAANQMQQLLSDLLELSRIGRLVNPPTDISFGTIAQEAIKMLSHQITNNNVQVKLGEGFPIIRADRLRMIEVVQNLCENALKFMGDQPQPQIEIGHNGVDTQGNPIFFIKDNGVGIESKYHETIFGLFHRLDQSIEGTGIGLALVKRIIEVHGGEIWLESELGQGTTFHFTLGTMTK